MVERVTERDDGVTAERVTETGGTTTVIERSGGGGGAGLLIGFILLIAVAIGAFYLISQNNHQNPKDAAITSAAKSVEKTADKAGDAIDKATNN
jgi:predicted metalloprotease